MPMASLVPDTAPTAGTGWRIRMHTEGRVHSGRTCRDSTSGQQPPAIITPIYREEIVQMHSLVSRKTLRLSPLAALALVVAACSGSGSGAVGGVVATPAPTAAPTATPNARMEVQVVSAVRPKVDAMTAALRSEDLPASLAAYEAYDALWNGVEVYINFRSKPTYDELEGHLQNAIEEGLAEPKPDYTALTALSEQLGKEFDKAIALVTDGAPLNPLFDDVTRLRMIRSDLRITTSAIAANDVAKAKAHWTTFKLGIATATDLIRIRSAADAGELTQAVAAADAAFADSAATADNLKPLVATVTSRYNFGVGLWNAAARNADASKTTYTQDDLDNVTTLNDVAIELKHSLAAWQAGDLAAAARDAAAAAAAFATVQPKLAAHNGADAQLKTALEAYAELAKAPGEADKVASANRTAVDASTVAQQVFVGQFWTDKALQDKLSALPKP